MFLWSEPVLDEVNDFGSRKIPCMRQVTFGAGYSQRRQAKCLFEMALELLIGSGQFWVRTAKKLELNQPAIMSRVEMKTQLVRQA